MSPPVLLSALTAPASVLDLTPADWDLLIRQARRANLLARLARTLKDRLDELPQRPRQHLQSALLIAARQGKALRWEVECIQTALAKNGDTAILLKGAAYATARLPAAVGRLFGDVDILVPRARIDAVEAALQAAGWRFDEELSDYDSRYYRQWMHEIPPMRHIARDTCIDVHHTILPPTARIQVNTAALFEDTVSVGKVRVLAPISMFLHSAAHLFHEGELDNGLRDLFDLDGLLRDFGASQPDFWQRLVPRAEALGLTRPMFYALRYTQRWLATPVPDEVSERAAAWGPSGGVLALMDACYDRALMPRHDSCDRLGTGLARLALYVRAHWLRMPLPLLARHLLRKAWMRLQPAPVQKHIA